MSGGGGRPLEAPVSIRLVWFACVCVRPQTDNDGQFLLIEAAHHIPKWVKPENAEVCVCFVWVCVCVFACFCVCV